MLEEIQCFPLGPPVIEIVFVNKVNVSVDEEPLPLRKIENLWIGIYKYKRPYSTLSIYPEKEKSRANRIECF